MIASMSKPIDGKGSWSYPQGTYNGMWMSGQRNGHGVFLWTSGDRYEGQWRDDKMEGKGLMRWADGKQYQGEWMDGKKQGLGLFLWADGNRHEGHYMDDKMNGRGLSVYAADGRTTHAGCDYSWNAGDRYDGGFKDNVRHGQCKYTFFNGESLECSWVEGQCAEFVTRQCLVFAASAVAAVEGILSNIISAAGPAYSSGDSDIFHGRTLVPHAAGDGPQADAAHSTDVDRGKPQDGRIRPLHVPHRD